MYENGALTWDAPCVTGNVSKNYTTPEGIYSLTYKQTDRVLRGTKQADGTYEYESHVDYWIHSTAASVSMTQAGEVNSAEPSTSIPVATAASICRLIKQNFSTRKYTRECRFSATTKHFF